MRVESEAIEVKLQFTKALHRYYITLFFSGKRQRGRIMRLPIEKFSNQMIVTSNSEENTSNIPPLWIRQAGLDYLYFGVCKVLDTLKF